MEARFAAFEQHLLRDQEEKFLALKEAVRKESETESAGIVELRGLIVEKILPLVEQIQATLVAGTIEGRGDKLDYVREGSEVNKEIVPSRSSEKKVLNSIGKLEEGFKRNRKILRCISDNIKKKCQKKRKRRTENSSSSSSSCDEDGEGRRNRNMEQKKTDIVKIVVEKEIKKFNKTAQKIQLKMESDSKSVMDQMQEIATEVHIVVANATESLDSIKNVTKNIEELDIIQTGLSTVRNIETKIDKISEVLNVESGSSKPISLVEGGEVLNCSLEGGGATTTTSPPRGNKTKLQELRDTVCDLLPKCDNLEEIHGAVSENRKITSEVTDSVKCLEEELRGITLRLGELGGCLDEVRGHIHRLEHEGLACSGFEGLAEVKTKLQELSVKVDVKLIDVGLSGKEDKHFGVDKSLKKDVSILVAETGDCIRKDICRYNRIIGQAVKRMVTLQQSSVESCKDNWMGLENMFSKNITALNVKIDSGLESLKAVLGEITESMIDINILPKGYKKQSTLQDLDINLEKCENTVVETKNVKAASNYDFIERNDKKTKKRKIDNIIDSKEDQYETIQEDIVMQCSSNVLTDKSTDLTKDLGNLQITRRDWSSLQQKLTQINDVIVTIPDVFASQAAILEENLCLNVTEKVKEVMKGKCELFLKEIDVIHREISFIKRVLKFSSKNEAEEDEEEEDNEWLRKI